MPSPLPPDEAGLNILNPSHHEPLARLARLAQSRFHVPIVAIALRGERGVAFAACLGIDESSLAPGLAFFTQASTASNPLAVPDASADPLFESCPVVTGPPAVRFFAAAPLAVHSCNVGAFCLFDPAPHSSFSEPDAAALADFAALASLEIARGLPQTHAASSETERWEMACAAHNDGVFDWSVSTGEVFVSPRCAEILGEPYSNPSGHMMSWFPSMHANDRPGVESALELFLTGLAPTLDVEFRVEDPDGSLRWLRSRASARRDSSGNPLRVAGALSDITPRKRDEVSLRLQAQWLAEARDKAEAATRAKSAFLATISHEIRTPINAIVGMTSLLGETSLDRHQKEFVETIRGSGETLLALIADILDFSKIEAGRLELDSVEFEPRAILEQTAELLAGAAYAKGVEIVLSLHPSLPARLCGDPGRFRQVLVNLVGNAVKFTTAGHVLLRAEPRTHVGQTTLFVQVSDTGIGIPREALPRIFEPFVQADSSTTRRFGGTGLGLAIAKQIVECMNGYIGAESVPGLGSHFRFEVPTTVVAPATAPPFSLSGRSALLVEDNDAARQAIREQLEFLGCHVDEAVSFGQAGALLKSRSPGFALVDFELPNAGVYELCAALNSSAAGYPPIILMATRENRVSLAETLPPGVHAVIAKPIRPAALRDAVARALRLEPPRKPARFPAEQSRPTARPTRILLAEDNPVNQRVATLMLQKLGFDVDVASDGIAAIESWKQGRYPIVLMDCQMPELDGLEATRRIRQLEPPGQRSIIIALTANAQREDRERCELAGMDDYMIKPVRSELLKAKLDRWLPLASI
jgi:PAS domain S-box-containing protein